MSDRILVAFCSIAVHLLVRLVAFWIYEELSHNGLLGYRSLVNVGWVVRNGYSPTHPTEGTYAHQLAHG